MGCGFSRSNPPPSYHCLTVREMMIVREIWDVLEDDLAAIGIDLFQRLLATDSDFKKFLKRVLTEDEHGELIANLRLLSTHATKVMRALGSVIDIIEDQDMVYKTLLNLGKRHVALVNTLKPIQFFWPSLRDIIKERMGVRFRQEQELAFGRFFSCVATVMLEGFDKGQICNLIKCTETKQYVERTESVLRYDEKHAEEVEKENETRNNDEKSAEEVEKENETGKDNMEKEIQQEE